MVSGNGWGRQAGWSRRRLLATAARSGKPEPNICSCHGLELGRWDVFHHPERRRSPADAQERRLWKFREKPRSAPGVTRCTARAELPAEGRRCGRAGGRAGGGLRRSGLPLGAILRPLGGPDAVRREPAFSGRLWERDRSRHHAVSAERRLRPCDDQERGHARLTFVRGSELGTCPRAAFHPLVARRGRTPALPDGPGLLRHRLHP
mmetsp:Transcript_150087/g.482394  ORF Transcript_150087/g.482394 Transcript_150087/m.482394 type:complete len:206 (-) Transcript_150087:1082-1699(-)